MRHDEGEWQSVTMNMTQIAKGSFLVAQTLEERRQRIQAMSKSRFVPDRSSSPKLKPRRKHMLSKKKMQEDVEKAQKMQGKVNTIAMCFEMDQSAPEKMPGTECKQNKHNNTTLFRQIIGLTEVYGTLAIPL